DKGGSYAPLRDALQQNHARAVILIGEAADKIASAVEGVAPVHRARTLEEAVANAAGLAVDGDAVVLSPACASYDMFDNYEHRGRVRRAEVRRLRLLPPSRGALGRARPRRLHRRLAHRLRHLAPPRLPAPRPDAGDAGRRALHRRAHQRREALVPLRRHLVPA